MLKFIRRFIVIIAAFITLPAFAHRPIACYNFTVADSPLAAAMVVENKEVWCYQQLDDLQGTLFVFNADGTKVNPELSFTVDSEGIMTHTSLKQGLRTIHKVFADNFNPFSIPYKEPKGIPSTSSQFLDKKMLNSAEDVLRLLSSTNSTAVVVENLHTLAQEMGEFSEDADIKPWRGYWWAYNGRRLSNGSDSPMAKYDLFVKARDGQNPGAQSWENAKHRYHGINWEGHCNGWAASSVLRAEPNVSKFDEQSGVTFSVIDQKGLLAETDYCAKTAFFGTRYNGPNSNARDISAVSFHKTLRYYIGSLKKPVAVDYQQLEPVDNHVISGYTMKIKKIGTNSYSVSTKVRMHKYDKAPSQTPGEAPMYTRTYTYRLYEADDGSLTGSWTSTNPDFLWVPLASEDCNSNNPRISHDRIQQILDLPPAQTEP